eukprot:535932-Alexandrium_andersonii.AAC.2
MAVGLLRARGRVRSGDFRLAEWPGADNPADVLTKAANGEIIGKRMPSLRVAWEGWRAETA